MSPTERVYRQFSGTKLKEARLALGISRNRLAPYVGCTVMSLYSWETGKRTPSSRFLAPLASNLRTTIEYFYDVQVGSKKSDAKG